MIVTESEYRPDYKTLKHLASLGFVTENGLVFSEDIGDANGLEYTLYVALWHSTADIQEAILYLQDTYDVSKITVAKAVCAYPVPHRPRKWGPERKERAFRTIVAIHTASRVDDVILVDVQSANAVVLLLDALQSRFQSADKKRVKAALEKYLNMPASKMVRLAWKMYEARTQ